MLPAAARMRRRAEFAAALRGGRRAGGPLLSVHLATAADDPGPAPAHVGFVVSRRVGPAAVRNRVTRRLRHLVAARLGALPPGSALVVRATPAAAGAGSAALGAELDRSLDRLLRGSRS